VNHVRSVSAVKNGAILLSSGIVSTAGCRAKVRLGVDRSIFRIIGHKLFRSGFRMERPRVTACVQGGVHVDAAVRQRKFGQFNDGRRVAGSEVRRQAGRLERC
jgi:hypothetical protein